MYYSRVAVAAVALAAAGAAGGAAQQRAVEAVPSALGCDATSWVAGEPFGCMGIAEFSSGKKGKCKVMGVPEQYVPGMKYMVTVKSKGMLGHKIVVDRGELAAADGSASEKDTGKACRSSAMMEQTMTVEWTAPSKGSGDAMFSGLCGSAGSGKMFVGNAKSMEMDACDVSCMALDDTDEDTCMAGTADCACMPKFSGRRGGGMMMRKKKKKKFSACKGDGPRCMSDNDCSVEGELCLMSTGMCKTCSAMCNMYKNDRDMCEGMTGSCTCSFKPKRKKKKSKCKEAMAMP